ncbi:MAG: PrsW family glutamic-type intramembrane protease [Treponema sp.]|nr:PrsW family glutamic-type intramembrane protease [Treponema sp.]
MSEIRVLLLLLLASAFPAIIALIWFKLKKHRLTLPLFLLSLTAGIISFMVAAILQEFIPPIRFNGLAVIFYDIFIRIAMSEEVSRIIVLVPFILLAKKFDAISGSGAALGLIIGLGFALVENAYHGISDISITWLRAFTAAPLHGACGIRVGAAVFSFNENKGKSLFWFISAVFIHGAYNLAIVSPALPSMFAIFIALAAFFASISLTLD